MITKRFFGDLGAVLILAAGITVSGCSNSETFSQSETRDKFLAALKFRPTDPDKCAAMMTEIIDASPIPDAYYHRGWIYAKKGEIDKAKSDVAAGLALDAEHFNLLWLDGELKKPEAQRNFEAPPQATK